MLNAFLAASVLLPLFVRDVRLLVSAGPNHVATACGVYSGLFISYAVALARWLIIAHVQRPDRISIGSGVWIGIVAVHLFFGGLTWPFSGGSRRERAWIIAVAPSPGHPLMPCAPVSLIASPDRSCSPLLEWEESSGRLKGWKGAF